MSEISTSYSPTSNSVQQSTLGQLRSQCHELIDVISKRPGAVKLLLGVLPTLELYAQYKTKPK